jgi:hypothetical protein
MPFKECVVDLIGTWTIQVQNKPYELYALTMIDTVSNLVELVQINNKTLAHIAKKYAQVWLSRNCGQHAVSMIMEANSLGQSSNSYYKVVESKMFQPPVKIYKPMRYVSACIRQ